MMQERKSTYIRLASGIAAITLATMPMAAFAQSSPAAYTYGTRYDLEGRVTGTIAPDPDGTGTLKFQAVRNSYDVNGLLIKVESGELASWQAETIAPASWTGFTVQKSVTSTYDAMGRKLVETVKGSDGVAVSLTQYSYDVMGRPECTAQRMNTAIYASLPASACTLGTQGSAGPDRITRNVYSAGRLEKVQKAVGTSLQQDYVSYTYTANGKQASVTDANGARATYEYDGLDRPVKWRMPSKTTAGVASTDDYEQYGYDANGNRTSLRKRDGRTITYTYDNLNRVTSKIIPDTCPAGSTPPACTTPPAYMAKDVYYGYDLRGLQTYARFNSASGEGVTQSYNGAGHMVTSSINMDGVTRTLSYKYDANGNRSELTMPDGQ